NRTCEYSLRSIAELRDPPEGDEAEDSDGNVKKVKHGLAPQESGELVIWWSGDRVNPADDSAEYVVLPPRRRHGPRIPATGATWPRGRTASMCVCCQRRRANAV